MHKRARYLFSLFFCFLLSSLLIFESRTTFAQSGATGASITGTVSDAQGVILWSSYFSQKY